jgi:hypothetical protein
MFGSVWVSGTAAERCSVLSQCDDVGCQNLLAAGLKCRIAKPRDNRISWKVRVVESKCQSEGSTVGSGQEGTIRGAVAVSSRLEFRSAQPRRRVRQRPFASSMSADLSWNVCLTFHFTLTILFNCDKRMIWRYHFDCCMNWKSAYQLLTLHQTIDTAIRAVDDNQVEKIFDVQTPSGICAREQSRRSRQHGVDFHEHLHFHCQAGLPAINSNRLLWPLRFSRPSNSRNAPREALGPHFRSGMAIFSFEAIARLITGNEIARNSVYRRLERKYKHAEEANKLYKKVPRPESFYGKSLTLCRRQCNPLCSCDDFTDRLS